MSDSNSAYRIKQLEGAHGYSAWATKMIDILTDQDMDEYVNGSKTVEPVAKGDTATAAEITALAEWKKKQRISSCERNGKELEKVRLRNAHLEKRLARAKTNNANTNVTGDVDVKIQRPKGTAGNDYNIQDEMGLAGCDEDRKQYVLVMGDVRDIVHEAGIKWEQPWGKVPAEVKGKFFAVARERHPILKRYENDWATEELAKQFIKNRRRREYRKGNLEAPAQYAYLKANSAQRNQSAPRGRVRKGVKATTKDAKKAAKSAKGGSARAKGETAKSKAGGAKSGSVKTGGKAGGSAKAKGKKRAVESEEESAVESSQDEEDEGDEESDDAANRYRSPFGIPLIPR
ncbi:hypothetical protein C8R46DRAFT_1283945 [Mycena filopes]|nr:hypothetical protein C8R46DRAFT_1283945 [Mycena filopes]